MKWQSLQCDQAVGPRAAGDYSGSILSLNWLSGRSDVKNANMSQRGSLCYISTLSSDISAQVSFCGLGPSKLDGRSRTSRINTEKNRGQCKMWRIDVPGLRCCQSHLLSVIDRDKWWMTLWFVAVCSSARQAPEEGKLLKGRMLKSGPGLRARGSK